MKFLLDTSILIDVLRSKKDAIELVRRCSSQYPPSVSFVSLTEVMAGARKEKREFVLEFLEDFHQVPISKGISVLAGELLFDYARKGRTIHYQDAVIAASCLEEGLVLVTDNVKDFEFIEGLELEAL